MIISICQAFVRKWVKPFSVQGFTLLEFILAMALLSLVATVVLSFMRLAERQMSQSGDQVKERGNLSRTMNVMKRDLREGRQGIDTVDACDSDNPDGVCILTSPATLSFKVPEGTEGTETTYKTIKYVYDSAAKTLTRNDIASTGPPPIHSDVIGRLITSVVFTQTVGATVLITLHTANESLVSEVSLRNRAG